MRPSVESSTVCKQMAKRRITVKALAEEAGIDVDEALITLWDAGFASVLSPSAEFHRGEANRARRALSLPTRRERASLAHWTELLEVDAAALGDLLQTLGVTRRTKAESSQRKPRLGCLLSPAIAAFRLPSWVTTTQA